MKLSEKDAVITAILQEMSAAGTGTAEHITTTGNKMEVIISVHEKNALEDLIWKADTIGAEVDALIQLTIKGDEPAPTDYEARYHNLVQAIRKEYRATDEILHPEYDTTPEDEKYRQTEYSMEWSTLRRLLQGAGEAL